MKKLLSLALVAIMLFALVACHGENLSWKVKELESMVESQTSKIAELEQTVREQETTIEHLEQKNEEQKSTINSLNQTTKELESTIKQQVETITGLQDRLQSILEDKWSFTLSELEAAYNEGKITREDLMYIAHQVNECVQGKVYEGNIRIQFDTIDEAISYVQEKCTLLDYEPSEEKVVDYTEGMEQGIKEAFLRYDYIVANYPNLTEEKIRIKNYYGVVNGCIITGISYPTNAIYFSAIICISIGNIVFLYYPESLPFCFSLN